MSGTATITAKLGANQSASSLALTGVRSFTFDCDKNTCQVTMATGVVQTYAGYSTIAATVSGTGAGASYTLTLS